MLAGDRRRMLAFFPALAAILLAAGETLTPKGLDNTSSSLSVARKEVVTATAHADRFYATSLLIIFGLGALGIAFSALVSLMNRPGSKFLGAIALGGWMTTLCGVISNSAINYGLAAAGAVNAGATGAGIFVEENKSGIGQALLIVYFLGMLVTVAVTAVALSRTRAVRMWLAGLFAITFYIAVFATPGGFRCVLEWIPFVVIMVILSVRVWNRPAVALAPI